jgi:hypothetical protein
MRRVDDVDFAAANSPMVGNPEVIHMTGKSATRIKGGSRLDRGASGAIRPESATMPERRAG